MSITKKTTVIATVLAGSIALSGSAFAIQPLTQGYMAATEKAAEAAPTEAKAEHHDMKAAEGKCGAAKKAEHDKSKAEGKCGAAKKADKAKMEGKCGEGKCGANK